MQRWLCYYCQKQMTPAIDRSGRQTPDQATRDHYIAGSKGGRRIVACCDRCNNLKGDWGAERFTRLVRELLENPQIDAMWHANIVGLTAILRRIITIERWKEMQRKKPNHYRQTRINEEVRTTLRLIKALKP